MTRVLFIGSQGHDWVAGFVFAGLIEELGAENVTDWPPISMFREPGALATYYWWIDPAREHGWDETEVRAHLHEFDLVIAGVKDDAREALSSLQRHQRLAFLDGEDYTGIRYDLIERFHPSIYFKVSTVAEPFELSRTGAPASLPCERSRCVNIPYRVIPFAMATTTGEVPKHEKTIDIALLGGNHFFGPRREGVAEDRQPLKPIFEQRLLNEFPKARLALGSVRGVPYVETLASSRIAIALGGHGLEPVRCYEILSCPNTMLLRWETGHIAPAPLVHGEHCASFSSLDEMIDLVRYYLDHEDERLAIARCGNKLLLEHYTPRARARHLLAEAMR